jgi:hypothetical protein
MIFVIYCHFALVIAIPNFNFPFIINNEKNPKQQQQKAHLMIQNNDPFPVLLSISFFISTLHASVDRSF